MKDPDFTPARVVLAIVRGRLELRALKPDGAGHAVLHRADSGAVGPKQVRAVAAFGMGVAARFSVPFENEVVA